MKKILFSFLTLSLLFLLTPLHVKAEYIQSFESQININKDGTIDVNETIVYDFADLQKHGIYRNIPYIRENKDGKFILEVGNISITDEQGNKYNYKKSDENQNIILKIGDANKTITGVHIYVISYKVKGALTYFSEHDELYWNVNGNEWDVAMDNVKATVIFPEPILSENLKGACYTGAKNETKSECTVLVDNGKIIFESDSAFRPHEGMTIVTSLPIDIVAVLQAQELQKFTDTLVGKIVMAGLLLAALFWYIIYPIKIIIKWYLYGRDPKVSGPVRAWFDPPKTKRGRVLTPAETGSLIDETVNLRDISGMIVSLAQRGYYKIVEKKKKDFYFIKKKGFEGDSSLLPFEKQFLKKVFESDEIGLKDKNLYSALKDISDKLQTNLDSKKVSTSGEIRLKDKKLYSTIQDISDKLYTNLVLEDFFPKNPKSIRTFYSGVAIAAAVTFNFHLMIIALTFGRFMPRKTEFGAKATSIAKSLKNFLSSQERQLEFQAKNQMMFEKLLPYAVVFGVEKIWAERFKDIDIKPPDWYEGKDMTAFNSVIFASSLGRSLSSFRSSATPTTSSKGFSSGFSSSGGFSGGGGGGGGGGSW